MRLKILTAINYDGESINLYNYKSIMNVKTYLETVEESNGFLSDNGFTIDDFDIYFNENEFWNFIESLEEPGIFEINYLEI